MPGGHVALGVPSPRAPSCQDDSPHIEEYLGFQCLPDLRTCWHYDDKIAQYYLFQAVGAADPEDLAVLGPRSGARMGAQTSPIRWSSSSRPARAPGMSTWCAADRKRLQLIDLMFGPGTYPRGFRPVSEGLDLPGLVGRPSARSSAAGRVCSDGRSAATRIPRHSGGKSKRIRLLSGLPPRQRGRHPDHRHRQPGVRALPVQSPGRLPRLGKQTAHLGAPADRP